MKRQASKLSQRETLMVRLYVGAAAFMILVGWAVFPRAAGIITTEAQSSCVTPPSGLIAWYPFEGNGNDIQGGHNAAVSGNAVFAAGKVGQSLQLDGSTVSAKVNASSTINVGAGGGMTVDAWIDPADVSSNQPLVEWNSGSGGKPYGVHLWISVNYQGGSAGDLFANIIDTNGNDHVIYSPNGIINANTFQHVALTYDKSDGAHGYARLYVNGVAQPLNGAASTVTDLGVFTPQTSYDLYFGLRPAGSGEGLRYKGLLDEVELFNRALSPTEVQNIFNSGGSPRCAPPDRIQFATATYTHIAQGSALLTVTRTNAQSAAAVQYATSDGTATAGTDYTATSGTLSFAAGESSKTISIPITTKTVSGPDKTINVTLSNATGDGVLGTPATAVLTISGAVGRILTVTGNADLQGLVAFNADAGGSNRISLTDLRWGNFAQYPSVSRQTGIIAFQGCGNDFPSPTACAGGRVFVMNADATGVRQLTFAAGLQDPNNQGDHSPVISPDGTKVAFISGRSRYPVDANGNTQNEEVFVVNVDGTNLHQVTTKQNVGSDNSRAYSVAWGPDSSKLVVRGTRLYHEAVSGDRIVEEVFTVNLDGSGEKVLAVAGVGANDLHAGDQNFPLADKVVDWSPDGANVVFAANYAPASNTGGIIDYVIMNPANPSAYHLITSDKLGSTGASAFDGSVRFSPDGQQLVYGLRDDSSIRRINLDGTNQLVIVPNDGAAASAKWWMGGPAIPQPARFTLTPNPLTLYTGLKQQVTPTLYDADGNVIVHAGLYDVNSSSNFSGLNENPYLDYFFLVKSQSLDPHDLKLCANNAGLSDCATVLERPGTVLLSVTATVPVAYTSGKSGPGVFTINRTGNTSGTHFNDAVAFTIQMGGTAQRDVDYTLDITGNVVTLPANQASTAINVRPIFNPSRRGDKTVTLTIQPDPQNAYVTDATSSGTLTIKDDGGSTSINLSSVTPNKGGDKGVVSVTVNGQNINQSATVKLARAGQADIAGESVAVAANGTSLNAVFNLIGKAQGVWDVIVTNPDGSTVKLPGAFTVEAGRDAQTWVSLVGRDVIRASHTATTYTVVYGNRGNVDGYMVPLVIGNIPKDAEVHLSFDVQPVPDAPGEPPLPQEVKALPPVHSNDREQFVSVLIPVVKAGSSNYLRFSIRFTRIESNTTFTLTASIGAPWLVPVPVNSQTPGQGKRLVGIASGPGGVAPPTSFKFNPSPAFISNMAGIVSAFANCVLGFLPAKCIFQVLGYATTVLQNAMNFYNGFQGTAAVVGGIFDVTTLQMGLGFAIAGCLGTAVPAYGVLNCILNVGSAIANIISNQPSQLTVTAAASQDPNEKVGSRGLTAQHYISGAEPLRYAVYFENKPDATAPAQTVLVTDHLDTSKVDLSTFSLGLIGFGDSTVVTPPFGLTSYSTDVDLRPAQNLIVRINAALDTSTGVVTWKFQSIDPATGQPTTDPLAGFLPPNQNGTQGEGSVLFTVMPKAGLAAGTQISNKATITFDLNSPLDTNTFTNTIDNSVPSSHVVALAAKQTSSDFTVNWSGTDTGSGVQTYDIYVSDNGGAFSPWLLNTTSTSALYSGLAGHTYAFYSVAHDAADNVEGAKTVAEATTSTPTAAVQFAAATYTVGEGDGHATLTVTRTGDTSGTSSVSYATVDNQAAIRCDDTQTLPGVAFARCDYATAAGTLTFAPGETQKSFTVPIIDDSFAEPDESFTVRLTGPLGAGLGANSDAAVTIRDNDAQGGSNPIDSTAFFVRQQYLDFLSREPEPDGLAAWVAAINNCTPGDATCDRVAVSRNFFLSTEFQLKGLFVFHFYKVAFGRMPTYGEIVTDMAAVTGSATTDLIARKAAYTSAFAQRQEFVSDYGAMTNQQFVDTLMGRYGLPSVTTIDPASPDNANAQRVTLTRADLARGLTAGTLTRGQVVRAIADSDEVGRAEFNPAFVAMQYFGYLRRDPETAGYNAWLNAINANPSDTRTMVNGFVNSIEYRLRFGKP